jgi:hypothetical protein
MSETATTERPTLLHWVPVDQITADARRARPGRAAQALIGGILFGIMFLIGKTFTVLFASGAWGVSALKMGWRSGRGHPITTPDVEAIMRENEWLRQELRRNT